MLFSSHWRADPCSRGAGAITTQTKSQGQAVLSEEEVAAQRLAALRCAAVPVQVLAELVASLNHSVTSSSLPFGTCKTDLINTLLQQIWSHILLRTACRPVTAGWPCSVQSSKCGTRL